MAMAGSIAAVKSSVYSVQLSLLEGISGEEKLHAAATVLTQSEYADVVTERTIVNMCGYPLCANSLPSTFPHKGRYHISLREHKVYDVQETRLFCSPDCLVLSKSFAASLRLERDHSIKTLELVAAFHNLRRQDVDHQQASSLAMEEVLVHKQESKEESHQDTPMQECSQDTRMSVHKQEFDLPVSTEDKAKQQNPPLKSDTFLLIHEQDEIKVTNFSIAGPPDAIEGYIPQKDFRPSCHMQDTDQDKNKIVQLSSGLDSKDGIGSSSRKKEKSKNKVLTSREFTDARRDSSDMQPEFTSCILFDQEQPAALSDANCKGEPASNHSESIKGSISHADLGAQVAMQNMKLQRSKRQNRVSWADHNNLNLVEDLAFSAAANSSGILKDVCNTRFHGGEGDQAVMPDNLTSKKVDVVVEGSSELLQRQESFNFGEEHGNIQGIGYRHEDLEDAKALVAALTEAADAVAHGEIDSSEAVARAGISILSRHEETSASHPLDHLIKEQDLDDEPTDEVENIDPRDCWYSAPPKDFKPELSAFGTLWTALDGWISAASIAHVYGKDSNEENDFALINGKEYLRQVIIPNGFSAEIERTIAGCISRALPVLVETLRFPVPVSTLEASLGRFLRTMTFTTAIPPLSSKQWQVVVLLFLDALSVHRLPVLRTRFLNGRQLLQKVLAFANVTEAEYEIFRDLVLPMGMLPDFAARCGG